ncbi:glucan biosynthesis protein [Devosia sp.]|uniref:glucan biosynthesis protein n=1 Tax=Devosia sp. TaxID=1871048 RepID=UPI003267751B
MIKASSANLPNRRNFLQLLGVTAILMGSTSLSSQAFAEGNAEPSFPFSFDDLTARMKTMAAAPYVAPTFVLPEAYAALDYDAYRRIQFRPDRGFWAGLGKGFQVQAFHPGWLFKEPVKLFELKDGSASPMTFTAEDFAYHDDAVAAAVKDEPFPGVAGFRLNYPLNSRQLSDELVSFLGASYFRALGRGNAYGLSARGLVINSWVEGPEEFPVFSEFYLERPTGGASLVVYAVLEGPSVAGAYRFEITAAHDDVQETTMDVTARLFFRADIKEVGIAPLTSMFLFAESNRAAFDDFRPQVHDSNGLLQEHASGEVFWRALNNSSTLGNSYLWDNNPRAFGLYQRDRDFEQYQDAGAHYEKRPSVRIEPIGDWGTGSVRLIEIPSKLEAEDNIGAFWVPATPVKAGDALEFRYLQRWGDLNPDGKTLAYVAETRAGQGGVSGVENATTLRKFVIDFKGAVLDGWDPATPPDIVATVTGGELKVSTVSKIDVNNVWRLVLDVETVPGPAPMELKAYLVGLGRQLTETWLYQWRTAA